MRGVAAAAVPGGLPGAVNAHALYTVPASADVSVNNYCRAAYDRAVSEAPDYAFPHSAEDESRAVLGC